MTSPNLITISNPQSVSMADAWYELATENHFWMDWRFQFFLKHKDLLNLKGPNLEIGCGNGVFLRQFERYFDKPIDGCDLNEAALLKAKQGKGTLHIYDILERNNTMKERYTTIFLMDVIEHIKDDVGFLKAAAFHLKDNGLMVINVPYGQMLYGPYDREAGHQKRYSKKSVTLSIRKAGLQTISCQFWGFTLLPLIVLRNLVSKFQDKELVIRKGFSPPSEITHKLLHWIKRTELAFLSKPPLGTSLMVICKKPGQSRKTNNLSEERLEH